MTTLEIIGASVLHLAMLSLISIGGMHVVFPDIYRFVVEQHQWITGAQFSALVALGQSAPGPNLLAMALVGFQVAGFWGAVAYALALVTPSSLLCYGVMRFAGRTAESPWKRALRIGFGPVTVGVVIASGIVLARAAASGTQDDLGWALAWAIAAAVGLLSGVGRVSKLNPLWWLGGAALLGGLFL